MQTIKVVHDQSKCIGCNSCVEIAPQCWMIDEETGKSVLIGSQKKGRVHVGKVFECDRKVNELAAQACPMQIIKVEG